MLEGRRVILSSNSPRRRELLSAMCIEFTVDTGNSFEESVGEGIPFDEIPSLMSEGKSLGFHRPLEADELLITADTMVILPPKGSKEGEILGKPSGRADAIRMLKDLSGREHHVVTAFTLRDSKHMKTWSETTVVHFRTLSDAEIEFYVDRFKPFDKAGAYAIQEWIGYVGIDSVDGSYTNVVGLPTQALYRALLSF